MEILSGKTGKNTVNVIVRRCFINQILYPMRLSKQLIFPETYKALDMHGYQIQYFVKTAYINLLETSEFIIHKCVVKLLSVCVLKKEVPPTLKRQADHRDIPSKLYEYVDDKL